jgi:hypothetical protein
MGKNKKRKNKQGGGNGGRDAENSERETEKTSDGVAWKKVDVGLSEAALVPGNHYDEDDESLHGDSSARDDEDGERELRKKTITGKRRRKRRLLDADQDLEASGGEEMGFFSGLEVISPDDYKVETDLETGVRRFRVLKEPLAEPSTVYDEVQPRDWGQEAPDLAALLNHPDEKVTDTSDQDAKKHPSRKKMTGTVADRRQAGNKDDDSNAVSRMQVAWLTSTGGVELHPKLCRALVSLGFWTPTPIQAATLPASILGQRNIVGCAPTGSGKTLSFLLSILQELLMQTEEDSAAVTAYRVHADSRLRPLKALVLSPTRELALQIQQACESLVPKVSVAVVGGLAVAKQTRLLDRQPPIVIGTPGRLWDMVRTSKCWFPCTSSSMKTFRSFILDIRLTYLSMMSRIVHSQSETHWLTQQI